MSLRNIALRRFKMFNAMRSVYRTQSKGLTGILSMRIADVNFCGSCNYSTHVRGDSSNPNPENYLEDRSETPKRKVFSPKITLITPNLTPTVVTLEEAQKISKRRDLKLVRVIADDHKSHRPVYKLMTGAEYFQEDLLRRKEKSAKRNTEAKDPKLLTISAKIGEHDLRSKIKNIVKWLDKRHEVRIVINAGDNFEAADKMCGTIETEAKTHGKLVQKRTKGTDMKFQLIPLKKSSDVNEKATQEAAPAES